MHQHPVRECHAAEANFVAHPGSVASAACLSAAWSSSAAGPRPIGRVVELDDRHHLADGRGRESLLRSGQLGERVGALLDGVPRSGGELDHRGPRHAGEDAELERRRVERSAAAPPDVRRRALQHDPVRVDEDRVVGAAAPGLGLGGHVDGVARRLHSGQEPGLVGADAAEGDQPLASLAQSVEVVGGSR